MRLVEVARDCGTEAHLIDNAGELREEWLDGARVVGISSGASAPENLVQELVDVFRARGVTDISEFDVIREDVRFMLPKPIREAAAAGEAADRASVRRGAVAASRARHSEALLMRTLIVSDLHLGRRLAASTCCARERVRETLLAALEGVDRLVLLGDVLELRHGPPSARRSTGGAPFFEDLGERSTGASSCVVAGNHDHLLVEPWLARAHERPSLEPLGLEQRSSPRRPRRCSRGLASGLAPARCRARLPRAVGAPRTCTRRTATTSTAT